MCKILRTIIAVLPLVFGMLGCQPAETTPAPVTTAPPLATAAPAATATALASATASGTATSPASATPAVTPSPTSPSATVNPAIPVEPVLPTLDPNLPAWRMIGPASPEVALQVTQTLNVRYTSKQSLDVYAPAVAGNWPLVILLHGGGGYKGMMSLLARAIAERGAVVFVPTYYAMDPTLSNPIGQSNEDAACAVRFGRAHASQYGGHADRVIIVGHSFGGAVGAVMMLAGNDFHGDCLTREGSALPDAFVGLDGAYDLIGLTDPAVLAARPAECRKMDPFTYVGRTPKRENITFLLFVGSHVGLEMTGQAFRDALQTAGYHVELYQVPGIEHMQMGLPQPATVDAIASLLRP